MIRASKRTRQSKYHAVRTEVDGVTFASKREAARYAELKMLERCGAIHGLKLQPRFDVVIFGEKVCSYVADFQYFDNTSSRLVTEDVKGMKTPVYRLKKKLMKAVYGIEIAEV